MSTVDTFATDLAELRDAVASLGPAAELAAAGFRALAPELPPVTAPHGPGAARQVAQSIANDGHHSHLITDSETVCLSGTCGRSL